MSPQSHHGHGPQTGQDHVFHAKESREMIAQIPRISAPALAPLALLALLALAACDSRGEPTSMPTLEPPATVTTSAEPTPTIPPSPARPLNTATKTPPPPSPGIPPSPTRPLNAATNTPSLSPTEQTTEALPGHCGQLCNYEFWQGGEVSLEDVRVELERGADVNARHSSGDTPLLWAVHFPAPPEIIRLLLDHGADPAAKARPFWPTL